MAYVAANPKGFVGLVVGDGQCVAYARMASKAPSISNWIRGLLVLGNKNIRSGTLIATFDPGGRYGNHKDGRSHAAIYLAQDSFGLSVIDQWVRKDNSKQPVHPRQIQFKQKDRAENDGRNYYVVE